MLKLGTTNRVVAVVRPTIQLAACGYEGPRKSNTLVPVRVQRRTNLLTVLTLFTTVHITGVDNNRQAWSMRVAIVGSYGAGLTMRLPRSPAAGETVTGGSFSIAHGGKGSNQAVGAARLGATVNFCTALGTDAFAADARQLWVDEGVQADVTLSDQQTMVGLIMVEPSGENRIALASGALSDLDPAAVDRFDDKIAAADVLLVCLEIPVDTALYALRVGKRHGVRTILNPAPAPDHPLPADAWPLIDVLTPNQTEAQALLGATGTPGTGTASEAASAADLAAELPGGWPGTLVITLGADGAWVISPERRTHVAATVKPRVVDTTGAGDAFNAALAVALARGDEIETAVRYANFAGAHAVTRHEVIPSLPHAADLARSLG